MSAVVERECGEIVPFDNALVPALTQVQECLTRTDATVGELRGVILTAMDVLYGMSVRMDAMERMLAQMVPITAAQARALGDAIRARAAQLAGDYGITAPGARRSIGAAIRRAVRQDAGIERIEEMPRTLYDVYVEFIAMWDDYDEMCAIARRYGG